MHHLIKIVSLCVVLLESAVHTSVYLYIGELQYLELGVTSGVTETSLPLVDDSYSGPITIPTGFPLLGSRHSTVFVSCKANSATLLSTNYQ